MRTLAAFLRSERGSFGVMAALTLPLTIGFAALGTDYGYFLYDRQQLQHSVDLAALSAAAMAGEEGETARRIVAENGYGGAEIEVTLGSVEAGADGRTVFREGRAGGAVRVEARRPTSLFFSRLYLAEAPVVAASAIAEVQPAVSLGLGSRLAVASGGIPAALTGALLGSRIDLSVLGYDGLVRSKLTAQGLLATLADTLGLAGATIGDLLDREVSVKLLVQAVAQTLRQEGQPAPAANISHVAYDLTRSDATIRLGEILSLPQKVRDLSVKSPSSYLTADLSAAGLLTAALSPRRSGSALETTLAVPGLLSTRLELLVGEDMVSHPPLGILDGTMPLSTAQVRSRLRLETGTVLGLVSAKLAAPIELAVAAGEARVVSATCSADPARRSVTVEVAPGAARLEIAETPGKLEAIGLNPSGRLVEILSLPLVKVKAHAVASLRAFTPTRVTFTGREIGNGTVRQVGSTRMVRALIDDLFHSLTLDVRVLGLGLGLGEGPLAGVVKIALTGLAGPLDTVLDGILAALGLKLGALDVRVDDIVCDQPRIVG